MADPTTKKLTLSNWSYGGQFGFAGQIPTPISEKGIGPSAELKLNYARNMSRFSMGLGFQYMMNKMKLLPTGSDATEIDSNHLSLRFGFGKENFRPLSSKKGPWGFFTTSTNPYVGYGMTKVPPYSRVVGGERIDVEGTSAKGVDIGTTYRAGLDILIGKKTYLTFGPELTMGFTYGGDTSEFNRMAVQAGAFLSIMTGGKAESEHQKGKSLDGLGLGYALGFKAHGLLQRYITNAVLNNPAEAAEDAGLLGGGDPGNLADLPALQMISFLLGGVGKGSQMKLFMNSGDYRWWIALAEAVGGFGFLADKGSSGKSGGFGDVFNAGGMVLYNFFNIDTPKKRAAKGPKSVMAKARNVAIVRYLINAAFSSIGAGILMKDRTDTWGKAMLGGGMGAQAGLAFSLVPFSMEGITTRTTISYIPYSIYGSGKVGDKKMNGNRGGVNIRTELVGGHIASEIQAMSPTAGVSRADNDGSYENAKAPSEVAVALGAHHAWKHLNVFLGLDYLTQFGGTGSYKGGFGPKAGLELTLGLTRNFSLVGGVNARIHWLFPKNEGDPDKPKQGYQWEVSPYFGLRW